MLRAGLDATRLEAATGKTTPERIVARSWDSHLNAIFDTKTVGHPRVAMSPGERGCCMSHLCAWQRIASCPDEAMPLLVLEDDSVLADEFVQKLSKSIEAVHAAWREPGSRNTVLYCCADVAKWRTHTIAVDADLCIRETAYQWQTAACVIQPAVARVGSSCRLHADEPSRTHS